MRNLARAAGAERGGASIPDVFTSLGAGQAHIRRAEVTMIAGPPGAGKSTLGHTIALRSAVPTLYFSADSHAHTMALRTLAALTQTSQHDVEAWMEERPDWARSMLSHADHIRWSFDSSPTLEDIHDEVNIYREVMGQDPELIVVDNLIDVSFIDGDEYSSLRSLLRELKGVARDTGAALMALHHTSESVTGEPCPPRTALHGKVAQTPAMIWTVASGPGYMAVASVKNRYGPADASGRTATYLAYEPSLMFLADGGTR